MSTSPETPRDDKPTPPEQSAVILLLRDLGDTTWRMFVPTVGLLLLGVYVDSNFGTKPLGLIAGIVLGSLVAGFLIKKQLQKV
ncbi:MAG: AtpZ/AtpI family protein [Candidatus Saccharimonadales bacterium]